MQQEDVDRVQEFRKCIECFLCQDVCHVLRDHHKHDEFIGPRFLVYTAALEMHPLDTEDRVPELKQAHGIGYCNITKCCTKVCPEHITITDNAIIPLKERVVDEFYDPLEINPLDVGPRFFKDRPKVDVPEAYVALDIPRLQIQGDNDIPEFRERFTAYCPKNNPRVRHLVVPGADHVFTNWTHRKLVIAESVRWLKKQLA
jgi:ferredoxin